MENFIKQIAKKITKIGGFKITLADKNRISFTDGSAVFSCQKQQQFYLFRIGYVYDGYRFGPTYESDYRKYDYIPVSEFHPVFEKTTDNPDFVIRCIQSFTSND